MSELEAEYTMQYMALYDVLFHCTLIRGQHGSVQQCWRMHFALFATRRRDGVNNRGQHRASCTSAKASTPRALLRRLHVQRWKFVFRSRVQRHNSRSGRGLTTSPATRAQWEGGQHKRPRID